MRTRKRPAYVYASNIIIMDDITPVLPLIHHPFCKPDFDQCTHIKAQFGKFPGVVGVPMLY